MATKSQIWPNLARLGVWPNLAILPHCTCSNSNDTKGSSALHLDADVMQVRSPTTATYGVKCKEI